MKYLAILALIVAQALACTPPADHVKRMLAAEDSQGFSTITKKHLASRELSRATGPWRPLNIYFDLRPLNAKLIVLKKASLIPFYEKVFEATGAWWKNALKVNDDRSSITDEVIGGWEYFDQWVAPKALDMTQYDLLVKVQWADDRITPTLAWAGPEYRHTVTQRPISGILGVVKYGSDLWENNTDKKKAFQGATETMIHEFGHIIAFTSWGTYQEKNLLTVPGADGKNQYYWTGPKAMEVAKNYYKCSGDFKGLPLEVYADGKIGDHWQEAWFGAEGMTPFVGQEPDLFSAMTLALCEDSGWYQVDYGMAENYEIGKGAGCEKKDCSKQACDPQTDFGEILGPKRTVLGYCSKDANGCGVFTSNPESNCKVAPAWREDEEAYGANYGDNCTIANGDFIILEGGSIHWRSKLSVEASCNADQSEYSLQFKGAEYDAEDKKTGKDVVAVCKAAGDVAYNELSQNAKSTVKCEDPEIFCKARFGGQELCPQMCDNSGRCAHKANTAAGPVDFKTLVSRKMLGGTRTIRLAESGSGSVGENGWSCWCFKSGGFSSEASGSCLDAL